MCDTPMNKIAELFGHTAENRKQDWSAIVKRQHCPFISKKCYKVRKSDPETSIGSCTVRYGSGNAPVVICPIRFIQRRQIFTDCLHLLSSHEPGNELHIVREVSIPGGSVDYFIASVRDGRVKDFVGIEIQTVDTTGTVWPERQRFLRSLGIPRSDKEESSSKPFGMNWKMTAKTILVQLHHKIQTFEHVHKRLVLVLQDKLFDYMKAEFKFDHLHNPAMLGDSMHLHVYQLDRQRDRSLKLCMQSRISTDAGGIAASLGLQAEARVDLTQIVAALEAKISLDTLFKPV